MRSRREAPHGTGTQASINQMARDYFTKPTKNQAYKRVACRCSNPDCRATISASVGEDDFPNVGVDMHIHAHRLEGRVISLQRPQRIGAALATSSGYARPARRASTGIRTRTLKKRSEYGKHRLGKGL